MSKFHNFKINKTAEEFQAQVDRSIADCDMIAIPVSAKKLYADTYEFGDGVSIETADGAVWLGEINDTSDYYVDDEHGFIQCPTEVYIELM